MLGVWDEDGRLSLLDAEFSATGGFALQWALGHVGGYFGGVSWHLVVDGVLRNTAHCTGWSHGPHTQQCPGSDPLTLF